MACEKTNFIPLKIKIIIKPLMNYFNLTVMSRKLKRYRNDTGLLIPFSLKKNLPFKCKRIFIIYGKKNSFRGNHAHYKCSQFLVPLYGSINIEYENKSGKFKKNYHLIKIIIFY